ncbi:hypothetical protein EVG20_g2980 [Dentipellis fragilis]|uniref:Uncharacterized protein n=1 Tax=Dentipellis fragilis TaxID=205917 RepID=A0A4Y9Z760_9AGAM|nr:hypothetical protein EVG20_g2980 [Dentipellis fragilis]
MVESIPISPSDVASATSKATANGKATLSKHAVFYFPDGTLFVQIASTPTVYNVHRTLLTRHTPVLEPWIGPAQPSVLALDDTPRTHVEILRIPESAGVQPADFDVLLEHLYHDAALVPAPPFPRLAALLRITSPHQLSILPLATQARTHLAALFPGGPTPFAHLHPREHLEDALALAMAYPEAVAPKTKNALLYGVATSTNFDPQSAYDPNPHTAPPDNDTPQDADAVPHPALTPRTLRILHRLLAALVADFTPLLFTVGAASHMECTDILAERWMADVIGPSLVDGGVARPLETLARVSEWDWAGAGVCKECVEKKREEWAEEAGKIWDAVPGWVKEAEDAEEAAAQ